MKKLFAGKIYQLASSCCLYFIFLLPSVYADTDTEQQIKLSFIYNIAKFVTWSNLNNPAAPLIICVQSTQPLASNIALLQNKKINTHAIQVRFLAQNKKITDCNMLFINENEPLRLEKALQPIADLPILTVSTQVDFAQAGGMVEMKELDNRLRFDVNLSSAKKAGLSISSQLLQLADEVIQ